MLFIHVKKVNNGRHVCLVFRACLSSFVKIPFNILYLYSIDITFFLREENFVEAHVVAELTICMSCLLFFKSIFHHNIINCIS